MDTAKTYNEMEQGTATYGASKFADMTRKYIICPLKERGCSLLWHEVDERSSSMDPSAVLSVAECGLESLS